MRKFLIIEDHDECTQLYVDLLGKENKLTLISSLRELEGLLADNPQIHFDVIVADLKLTDGMFLDWITRTESSLMERFPTIIASSISDLETLKTSFEWGATDFLIKPFHINELLAKIDKAQKNYVLKPGMESLKSITEELTSIEGKILQKLIDHPNQYVSRDLLVSDIWRKVKVNPKTLDVHLSNLRKKLTYTTWTIDNSSELGWKLKKIR